MATTKKNVDAAGRRARKAGEPPLMNFTEHEPTAMQEFYAKWLEENTGYKVDLRSTILASVLRGKFQKSPENQARLAEAAEARQVRLAELAERRAARAEKKAAEKAAKPAKAEGSASAKKAASAKPAKKTAAKAAPAKKSATKPAPRRRPAKSDEDF